MDMYIFMLLDSDSKNRDKMCYNDSMKNDNKLLKTNISFFLFLVLELLFNTAIHMKTGIFECLLF